MSKARMKLKLNQVRMFIAVVESRSIHRGAITLGLSQPAVSAGIRELELTSGGALLTRSSKGVEVTEMGAVLLQRGRALLADVARMNEEMARVHSEEAGTVSISVSSFVAYVFVSLALQQFYKQMPNVQVRITEISGRKALVQGLHQGDYDFAVMHTSDYFYPMPDDIERLATVDLPLILGCRSTHPLARATSITQLAGAQWILPAEQDKRGDAALAAAFGRFGSGLPFIPIRVGSLAAALSLYESMDLIGFFAKQMADVTFDRYNLVQIPIQETLPPLKTGIFQRAAQAQTTAAACLIECFRSCMQA
jgi:LysR family transcriptional regulator of abg operon